MAIVEEFPTVGGVTTGLTSGEISFSPSSLNLEIGSIETFTANLVSRDTIVSTQWYATITGITQLHITTTKQNEYSATFEIDVSRAVNNEMGTILVTAEGQTMDDISGGYKRFVTTGEISYRLRTPIEPDFPPIDPDTGSTTPIENTLSFTPPQLSITAGTSGVVNSILTSNKELSWASWTAEDYSNTGVNVALETDGYYNTTVTIDATNLTVATSGLVKYNLTYQYPIDEEESGFEMGQETWYYRYNILPLPVDSEPVLTLSYSTVAVPVKSTVTVNASVSMNEPIITTDWSIMGADKQLIYSLENNTSTSVNIKLDSTNVTTNEVGALTITANVLYLSIDGTQKRKIVTKNLNYTAFAAPNPDPEPDPEVVVKGDLTATPTKVVITKSPKTVTVMSSEYAVSWGYVENALLNITIMEKDKTFANFEIAPKEYNKDNETIVILRAYYNSDKTIYTDVSVRVEMQSNKIIAVWEDSLIELDEVLGDRVEYTLVDIDTNEIIYSGKVNKLPNGDNVNISINKIVGNFLNNPFPQISLNTTNVFSIGDYSKTVDVIVGGNIVETVTVYNSWGYKDLPYTNIISDPIRRVVDRRQFFVCSMYNPTALYKNVEYSLTNGEKSLYKYGIATTNKKQSLLIDGTLRNFKEYNKINLSNVSYDIIDSCSEWCLYYSNAYGGWDSLLVNGNVKKSDKISGQYYKQSYDNRTYQFGNTKYLNTITPSYVLYTDYFNDDEQSRLYHLLESTEVYLHNLNTNEFLPVNITNTTCDYTTYTNNGKKKWYNTINVDVAQEKMRK